MSPYPQIESMMRNVLERERVSLTRDVERATSLKEELAEAHAGLQRPAGAHRGSGALAPAVRQ